MKLLLSLFLAAAVLIPYWQVGDFDFIHMDDADYITENRTVRAGLTLEGTVKAFSEFHSANCHPLTWLSETIWNIHRPQLALHLLGRVRGWLERSAYQVHRVDLQTGSSGVSKSVAGHDSPDDKKTPKSRAAA